MAIKVGGKIVAGGRGADGKSAYQYAVDGGYTGTEAEFKELMGTGPWLPMSGGKMTGTLNMGSNPINLNYLTIKGKSYQSGPIGGPINSLSRGIQIGESTDLTLEAGFYVDSNNTPFIGIIGGINSFNNLLPISVPEPTKDEYASNKKYVDDSIASAIDDSWSAAY